MISMQLYLLFILAIPIACISWTITHEEIFREPREYFINRSKFGKTILERKFCYLFTCEYCFSHYVTIFILILTGYKLVLEDWRGFVISGFSLVWIANTYMSLFGLIRLDMKKDRTVIKAMEDKVENKVQLDNNED
jgi:hypothetical protein